MDSIRNKLSHLVQSSFGDNLLFAAIFGSLARGEQGAQSDVDLLVILKDYADTSSIVEFNKRFIALQVEMDFMPDKSFPSEVVTQWKLCKAIDGYGFIVEGDAIEINPITRQDWTPFNEYRQWLCAMAGPNSFLVGDKIKFENLRDLSMSRICVLALLDKKSDISNTGDIIRALLKGGKEYMGFCDSACTRRYLAESVPKAIKHLEEACAVAQKEDSFKLDRVISQALLPSLTSKTDFEFKNNFIGKHSQDEDLSSIHEALGIGMRFIMDNEDTLEYKNVDEIKEGFLGSIPSKGSPMEAIFEEYQKSILAGSIRQSSPNYLAFPDAGNSIAGLCAELLIAFSNQNLIATTKSAPTATFVEIQVIRWLRNLVGYSQSSGFPTNAIEVGGEMVGGGTMANTIALLVARNRVFPESRSKGLNSELVRPILIVAGSGLHHYSHIASFWWLGLGEKNIVYVDMASDYRIDCNDLDSKLKKYNSGAVSRVVAVVCQAGDSRTTTIENLERVVSITKKHSVWLHVDACHGGALIFSKKYRNKLKCLENADSVSIDPHKGLCVTYPSSAVLFKEIRDFELLAKSTDITIQKGSYDLGQMTPFVGSKPFSSLKLWFLIKNLGLAGIDRLINHRFSLAERWHQIINESELFETLNEVDFASVTFTLSTRKLSKIRGGAANLDSHVVSSVNKAIHDSIYQKGHICIHTFDFVPLSPNSEYQGLKMRVLGVNFGNPITTADDFPEYLNHIQNVARRHLDVILKKP